MDSQIDADKALISALGGTTEVARLLKCSVQVVSNWNRRGIPARVKLARPDLFLRELAKPSKPSKRAKAKA